MIHVQRVETLASAGDVDALLASLNAQPGVWMGSDVQSDGLFRKESMACAVPELRFCLDGMRLMVTPMSTAGTDMLAVVRPLAAFAETHGGLVAVVDSGKAVVNVLRQFLAAFTPASPELALYGALSFDYFRLASDDALPDDNRRRLVLYFPQRVLRADESETRWIDFRFDGKPSSRCDAVFDPAFVAAGEAGEPARVHAARVAKGIDRLRRAELFSLVLSQAFRWRTATPPAAAFRALRGRNPYPAMFFCNLGGGEVLFGASPDLQVRANGQWVEAAPVCGTVRRGADPIEDQAQAYALLESEKEGAAIALCADAAASDMAQVCVTGTVELISHRRVHFFSTIIHAVDHLRGRRKPDRDGFDILLAHSAPATVTGLPKARAIRAIEELESGTRGWYAGAVARIGTDASVEAYTILRAARVADGVAEIRVGGNILADSDPMSEEQETRLKAETLFQVLDGAPRSDIRSKPDLSRWGIRFVPGDDPSRARLADALARAGAMESGDAEVLVLSGIPSRAPLKEAPLLAVGDGALWLLKLDGARGASLPVPAFARTVHCSAERDGFLAELGSFQAGWYADEGISRDAIPPGWRASAVSREGWVLAAEHRERPACALLFRPDSVLSLRGATGVRALRAALVWLDGYGTFDRQSDPEAA